MAYDFIDCVGDDVDVVSDSEVCTAFEKLTFLFFFLAQNHAYTPNVNSVFCHMQNIKKLLKIPYSKSHVSMAVHRVGRTLLLDELDIQELFMSSSQVQQGFFSPDFYFTFIPDFCAIIFIFFMMVTFKYVV